MFFWVLAVLIIFWILKFFQVFGWLRTSLLCIAGELAGGGPVALAIGVSDRWQVTGDVSNMACDTSHVTPATCHLTLFFFFLSSLSVRFFAFLFNLVSPHFERFYVSRMQEFVSWGGDKTTHMEITTHILSWPKGQFSKFLETIFWKQRSLGDRKALLNC